MSILVTGAAGFIGYHLAAKFLSNAETVIGLDNLNNYYSVKLKEERVRNLKEKYPDFKFYHLDLVDKDSMFKLFETHKIRYVVNMAAQAGVRYSLEAPEVYIQSNLVGFGNILEVCRHFKVEHLLYASSSSVYGLNETKSFSVHDNVDHPISLYAASKKANELMAHSYSWLFNIPTTGLRFFTVYGPWGRPDMALFKFTQAILAGKAIDVYNYGNMERDFTYIDDIVEAVYKLTYKPVQPNLQWQPKNPDPSSSPAPYRIYNIGNNKPVSLNDFIQTLEKALGQKAKKNLLPLQPGDVLSTCADIEALQAEIGFSPSTLLSEGIGKFVTWYKKFQKDDIF